MKINTQIQFVVLILILLNSQSAFSGTSEVTTESFEDPDYKFYYCLGEDQESESKAIENAINDCYRSAISDNFGISTQIQQSTLESDYGSKLSVKKDLFSKKVELKSFEKILQKTIRENMYFKVYMKYRYKKSEILKEKLRISKLQFEKPALKVSLDSESDSTTDLQYNTELVVRTRPSKAKIFIDGDMMGFSNMSLKNILMPKSYFIRIEKENYESVDLSKEISENKSEIIDIQLKPKKLNLYFDLEPQNALLYIDGKLIKNNSLQVEAGQVLQIKIEKSDCITQEFNNYKADEKFGLLFEVKLKCRKEEKPLVTDEVPSSAPENSYIRPKDLSLGFGVIGLGFVSGSSKLYRLTTLNVGYAGYITLDNIQMEYQFSKFEKGKYEYASSKYSDVAELVASGSHQKLKFSALSHTGQFAVGLVYLNTEFKDSMPMYADKLMTKLTSVRNLQSYGGSLEVLQPSISKYLVLKGAFEILITPVPSSAYETSWGMSLGLYLNLN